MRFIIVKAKQSIKKRIKILFCSKLTAADTRSWIKKCGAELCFALIDPVCRKTQKCFVINRNALICDQLVTIRWPNCLAIETTIYLFQHFKLIFYILETGDWLTYAIIGETWICDSEANLTVRKKQTKNTPIFIQSVIDIEYVDCRHYNA